MSEMPDEKPLDPEAAAFMVKVRRLMMRSLAILRKMKLTHWYHFAIIWVSALFAVRHYEKLL